MSSDENYVTLQVPAECVKDGKLNVDFEGPFCPPDAFKNCTPVIKDIVLPTSLFKPE